MGKARPRTIFPLCLNVAEAATALGCSARRLRAAARTGEIPSYALGLRRTQFLSVDLIEWVRRTWKPASIKGERHG